jgi:hypothetical protein
MPLLIDFIRNADGEVGWIRRSLVSLPVKPDDIRPQSSGANFTGHAL